ncbi:GMC oxidoreductase [Bradyrhizobium sp.]|uniref:GMC oxidoreductase n=1 Tax=Bradyrhizobium sp. TaxID=376 RepID=UPI003C451B02
MNSMQHVIEHDDLDICVDSKVVFVDVQNSSARAVHFVNAGREYSVKADLVVLGANGIQSPALLLQSGFDHPLIGKYLHEKIECTVEAYLDGVDNFGGSTITTCMNVSLLDGEHRREYGGALLFFENNWIYGLRPEYGRWRQILPITINVEPLPQAESTVTLSANGQPHVSFPRQSEYGLQGVKAALDRLPEVLRPLPVERIEVRQIDQISVHLQGTLRMGSDPLESVVDAGQVHHKVRNLVVVGSSVFPTAGSGPPSLTVAALSLRAARMLLD